MKTFVICLDSGTPEKRNAITTFIQGQGWAFWHWIDDLWFVKAPKTQTAGDLSRALEELPVIGTSTRLVFQLPMKDDKFDRQGRVKKEGWNWIRDHIGPKC